MSSSSSTSTTMHRLNAITGHLLMAPVAASSSSSSSSLTSNSTSGDSSSSGRCPATGAKSAFSEVVIVSFARTPIGGGPNGGSLASLTAPQLGGIAIREAVKRGGIDAKLVEECIFGNVLSAGQGQAPARQAALAGGLANTTPSTTLNKVCASGMKAFSFGVDAIRLGERDVVVVGGMESMSNSPYLQKRGSLRMGNTVNVDSMINDGLSDAYHPGTHMGTAAELTAQKFGITRAQQDAYAVQSYERAQAATKSGKFKSEVVPIEIKGKDGKVKVITQDDECFRANFSKFPTLKPSFPTTIKGVSPKDAAAPSGTITAANSSSIGDGAAALVLMSAAKAKELGVKPIARVLSHADAALTPLDYTIAPEKACRLAVKKAGLASVDAVEIWELNEAFSVVALANMALLKIPAEKINLNGGAVSLGHPIGCSGARIICTLLSVLEQQGKKIGCAGLCNGGGGASAVVIERL